MSACSNYRAPKAHEKALSVDTRCVNCRLPESAHASVPVVPDVAAIVPDGVELRTWPPERRGGQHTNGPGGYGILALDTKSGLAVVSTNERSQYKNRERALERLRVLLEDIAAYDAILAKETEPERTSFWQSVSELAAMREHIPEERRALSGVRQVMKRDRNP